MIVTLSMLELTAGSPGRFAYWLGNSQIGCILESPGRDGIIFGAVGKGPWDLAFDFPLGHL